MILSYICPSKEHPLRYRVLNDPIHPLEIDYPLTSTLQRVFFPRGIMSVRLLNEIIDTYYHISHQHKIDTYIHRDLNLPFIAYSSKNSRSLRLALDSFDY